MGFAVKSEFAFKTIRDLSNGLARKDFSPTELLASTIARYEAIEPTLNTFAHVDFEGAQEQAKASEARIMNGGKLSKLDGIPTSIKDLIAVKGMPMRAGSRATSDAAVDVDAPSVERLRAAGAVILGKSTTSEFGCKAVGDSQLTGITRNPWNTNLTPGGSSCGAAAMVSAGLVPYALGTDGGGSVRIPAALTGLFGIKANFGRVSVFPTSATPTLAHVGPLTRTAEDAATVLGVIAGYDKRDPFTVAGPQPDFTNAMRSYRNLRIAWSPTLGFGRVDPEVLQLTEQAVIHIQRLGLNVDLVDFVMDDPIDLWTAEFYAGVGTKLRDFIQNKPDLLDPPVLDLLRKALGQDMQTYYQNVFERYNFRERTRAFFDTYDVLLTPTLPVTAFEVGRNIPPGYEDKNVVSWAIFTYPFNLTGQPAASIPVGFASNGMPVGLQAISSTHDEISILALANAYQKSSKYHQENPTTFE